MNVILNFKLIAEYTHLLKYEYIISETQVKYVCLESKICCDSFLKKPYTDVDEKNTYPVDTF